MKRYIYIPIAAIIALFLVELTYPSAEFAHVTAASKWYAPYQYRVLFAYLFVGMDRILGQVVALWLFWFISVAIFALLMDGWLGRWVPEDRA
jgi:hypothetical protein